MAHDHSHSHNNINIKALKWSFMLIFLFMIIEVIGGIWTNSLALLSDAGHMLSDAAALGLSLTALMFGQRKATDHKTFGYKRFEILAAFLNGITLIAIALYIFYEAYRRLLEPPVVLSSGMLIISTIGLLVNIVVAFILMRADKDENLNVRSAFLHVIGDLLGSIGAIIAAVLIIFFGWTIADPIASLVVAILVFISGLRVTKDSWHILMEGVPFNLNASEIKSALLAIEEVEEVHDFRLWSITSDYHVLSCHLVVKSDEARKGVLRQARTLIHDQFDLQDLTIQIECTGIDECSHAAHESHAH
ncbi:cation diffusion facilitator family transporter (plasmid) [Exiguobacterium acetylicum]|nr:cation diffusion facilitator family transporter [Exiguobacterium acetylicum]QZY88498.1 cation diffusion facilitator family transporter [Exiguobacterium acetylicum]